MGWNTYHQIVTELSPKMWVYDNLITHVFTHKYYENGAKIKFTNDDAYDFFKSFKIISRKKYLDLWRHKSDFTIN